MITASLFQKRSAVLLVFSSLIVFLMTLVLSSSTIAFAAPHSTVQTVLAFDATKGELAENLVLDRQGTIYISLTFSGTIRVLHRDGRQESLLLPVGANGSVAGLAFDHAGRLYAGVSSPDPAAQGIWRFGMDRTPERIATLPAKAQPNGLTFDCSDNLYVTDSALGTIWRLPRNSTQIEAWAVNSLLAPDPNGIKVPGLPSFPVPGANGVKVFRNALYVSNSSTASILRIPLRLDGRPGSIAVVFTNTVADDFAFDIRGNLYTVTNVFSNELNRTHPDGTVETLANASDGLDGPSAVAFGNQPGDRTTLYITNLAILEYILGKPAHPSLQKLDVGIRGYPIV